MSRDDLTPEEERAWRRHEVRMWVIMILVIGVTVAVIGMVLGGKVSHAGDKDEAPAAHAVDSR